MIEVRRPGDHELCGFVAHRNGKWDATTVFGGRLGAHPRREDAERQVLDVGLASLAERWSLIDTTSGVEQIVCIQHASPSAVTVALGYDSLPGVPTRTIAGGDLVSGRWRFRRH